MIVFDTYAWIEYFGGTKKGKRVETFLNEEEIVTPSITLIELSCKAAKRGWDFKKHLRFIKSKSRIVGLTEETIIKGGREYQDQRKSKKDFSLPDAIILTIAKKLNGRILTGNKHFKDLKRTIYLK